MDKCPNCRARYRGGEQCHRCGMELELLLHIEQQREQLIIEALQALTQQHHNEALDLLQQAESMESSQMSTALVEFIRQRQLQ
ncbi:MAG: hypothetical protein HOL04_08190 [Gammaproteobacteria bacterium]|jgi:methylase of polypeptide subunit release factors|nr:hypothetical protein [Gammaproteobacteria bacterium]MBT4608183.1 hypothetical protein [Thiotrichales bacterium]MBT3472187.1 hypothetical protein [Gammaproteobacteria bacterium]MBT3965984.1 hypothetical protein [Gammaproteobacteria bacterium]MBT4079908.1 hypothetical protein [Gammaproteobacteria bacterium]